MKLEVRKQKETKNYNVKESLIINAKGVTLIAVVITIIILLILSGVAIATLTGENGLFARAKQAKENYSISSAKEKLQLAISDLMVEQTSKGKNLTKEYETSPVSILAETKFKRILAGYYHSLAIDEEGSLWTWGCNDYGALGDGTTENKKIQLK